MRSGRSELLFVAAFPERFDLSSVDSYAMKLPSAVVKYSLLKALKGKKRCDKQYTSP